MNEMSNKSTPEEQAAEIKKINQMSQFDMCALWRYAPAGHPYFDIDGPYCEVFEKRFKMLGRFTPEISKALS